MHATLEKASRERKSNSNEVWLNLPNGAQIEQGLAYPPLYLPHSRKLFQVKTFMNFTVLLPSAKVLSANFLCGGTGRVCGWQSVKVLFTKCFTLTDPQKFSLTKVSGCSIGEVTVDVTPPTCHAHVPLELEILAKTTLQCWSLPWLLAMVPNPQKHS